jgi:hypothetical protein
MRLAEVRSFALGKSVGEPPPEARSASEFKRLRAYEGLVVVMVVTDAVLVFGTLRHRGVLESGRSRAGARDVDVTKNGRLGDT